VITLCDELGADGSLTLLLSLHEITTARHAADLMANTRAGIDRLTEALLRDIVITAAGKVKVTGANDHEAQSIDYRPAIFLTSSQRLSGTQPRTPRP